VFQRLSLLGDYGSVEKILFFGFVKCEGKMYVGMPVYWYIQKSAFNFGYSIPIKKISIKVHNIFLLDII
jgi:hypothetical protein